MGRKVYITPKTGERAGQTREVDEPKVTARGLGNAISTMSSGILKQAVDNVRKMSDRPATYDVERKD